MHISEKGSKKFTLLQNDNTMCCSYLSMVGKQMG